jgi:hypothetical protein
LHQQQLSRVAFYFLFSQKKLKKLFGVIDSKPDEKQTVDTPKAEVQASMKQTLTNDSSNGVTESDDEDDWKDNEKLIKKAAHYLIKQ